MCITPCFLPEIGPVGCRYCWQCRKNRVNDYVGRCLAEQSTSDKALAVTLTYAESENIGASILMYPDFQRFIKRLRKKYSVRYIVAGEYGSKKGRAHWHCVLFFKGKYPEIKAETRVNWDMWPEGFSYFQEPDYGGFAYALKYALKDISSEISQGHLAMSKKPPLGAEYFHNLASKYVEQGISPQDLFYAFGDVFDTNGDRRKFYIQGKSQEIFLQSYLDQWEVEYGYEHPFSELISDYVDTTISLSGEETIREAKMRLHGRTRVFSPAWVGEGIFRGMPIKIETNETQENYVFTTQGSGPWHEERPEIINHILETTKNIKWAEML